MINKCEIILSQLWGKDINPHFFMTKIENKCTLIKVLFFSSEFLEAASIKESPSTMNVSTGDTVVMNCQAYGDPIPRIRYGFESFTDHNVL